MMKLSSYKMTNMFCSLMFIGNQPHDAEVDRLIDDVEKFTLANHLIAGLWAIISVRMNFFYFFHFIFIFHLFILCLTTCFDFPLFLSSCRAMLLVSTLITSSMLDKGLDGIG